MVSPLKTNPPKQIRDECQEVSTGTRERIDEPGVLILASESPPWVRDEFQRGPTVDRSPHDKKIRRRDHIARLDVGGNILLEAPRLRPSLVKVGYLVKWRQRITFVCLVGEESRIPPITPPPGRLGLLAIALRSETSPALMAWWDRLNASA